jgi:hypothetical protein
MESMGTLPFRILHQAAKMSRGVKLGLGAAETIWTFDANLGAKGAFFSNASTHTESPHSSHFTIAWFPHKKPVVRFVQLSSRRTQMNSVAASAPPKLPVASRGVYRSTRNL